MHRRRQIGGRKPSFERVNISFLAEKYPTEETLLNTPQASPDADRWQMMRTV